MPAWHVLHHESTTAPDWLVAGGHPRDNLWWWGVLNQLEPLYQRCPTLAGPHRVANLRAGQGVEAHPSQPGLLFTRCTAPQNFRGVLASHSSMLKYKAVQRGGSSHASRGSNAGYFKLRAGGLGAGTPVVDKYLHDLICFMYRGPPAQPGFECIHLCELKSCLCPWHLWWGPHQANMKGHTLHKRQRKAYLDPREAAAM